MALDIIPNNIAMANVCCVPQSYIYLRGQGAKIFSLITKVCDSMGFAFLHWIDHLMSMIMLKFIAVLKKIKTKL